MRVTSVLLALVLTTFTSGWATGKSAYRGPAHIFEIPNPVVVNDTITVRLKVEVRQCVDEMEAHYRNWQDSVIKLKQPVSETDTAVFDMCVRVPASGGFYFRAYVIERTTGDRKPCTREIKTMDADGNPRVELREIEPGSQSFAVSVALKRVGDTVIVTELIPVYDSVGRMKTDTLEVPERSGSPHDRGRPHIVETPGAHSAPDSQQVAPKDTAPETTFVPPTERTEEEKRHIDSLMGLLPWQQERARMAKLEEKPLEGVGAEFIEVEGVTYMRNRGEKKFRRVEGVREEDLNSRPQPGVQSRAYRGDETEFEIRVWLSNSEDLKYARTLIDSLVPTDDADGFLTRTSVKVIHLLENRGIKTAPIAKVAPEAAGSNEVDSGSSDLEPRPANEDASLDQVTLFSETFGGFWPDRWYVEDGLFEDSGDFGPDYWGQVNCNYNSAYWSAWCSGSGDAIRCDAPEPRINTWMVDTVGVDIAGMGPVVISYAAELDYPVDDPSISSSVQYSYDNYIWLPLANHDTIAPYPWWENYSFSILEGDRVYLKFLFRNWREDWYYSGDGVYIDDIEIVGWTPMNLTVFEAPYS